MLFDRFILKIRLFYVMRDCKQIAKQPVEYWSHALLFALIFDLLGLSFFAKQPIEYLSHVLFFASSLIFDTQTVFLLLLLLSQSTRRTVFNIAVTQSITQAHKHKKHKQVLYKHGAA